MKGKKGRLEIRTCKEKENGYCRVKIEIEDNGDECEHTCAHLFLAGTLHDTTAPSLIDRDRHTGVLCIHGVPLSAYASHVT